MTSDDVVATLFHLEMLGKDSQGRYVLRIQQDLVRSYLERLDSKGYPSGKMENLRWSPSLLKGGDLDDMDLDF